MAAPKTSLKFAHIQQFFFFGLLAGSSVLFLWMLGKYLLPVFWAAVLAIVFYPLYRRIERRCGTQRSIASLLTIIFIIGAVLLPTLYVGSLVAQESIAVYQHISKNGNAADYFSILRHSEFIAGYLEPYGISASVIEDRLRDWTATVTQWLTNSLISASQFTFSFVIYTAITFYLLFFFFRDGAKLRQLLLYYLPLGNQDEERLFASFTGITRAVVTGTLTIAALQGTLAGLAFWIAGVDAALLWGVVMAILAIIPAVGPALVWLPAGILLIISGSIWQGVLILVVGALLVSIIDEFLRPTLVGRRTNVPDAIILLATVGGLASFGVSGIIVGPVIAAFFLSLWRLFAERYDAELTKN